MKTLHHAITAIALLCALLCALPAGAQSTSYTNFIRQKQYPSMVQWDASVQSAGSALSSLSIEPGGATFELWTVAATTPLTSYLLSSVYVGAYIPVATLTVQSEDNTSVIPRTRADRPFYVDIMLTGLLSGATDPAASKSVNLLRYVQSYGAGGTGVAIDRTQATLLTQSSLSTNGTQTLTFALTSVPGSPLTKVRGEERFSIFSLPDPACSAPSSQLASQYIQIWPVADGTITGITNNQQIRYALPQVTLTLNDLYPSSTTYAQVYKGNPQLGKSGTIVPGSALVINDSIPNSRVLQLTNYGSVFDADGRWTLELLTVTPFGIDRLAYVSFDLDRTMKMNAGVTTIE